MSDNSSLYETASEDESFTLRLTPSPTPLKKHVVDVTAIRLNGDSIFYWEKVHVNPLKSGCWDKITHVFIDEMFVNQEDQVCKIIKKLFYFIGFGHPTIRRQSHLTRIETYFPWFRLLKKLYPHVKLIWTFHKSPMNIFVCGNYVRNLFAKMQRVGTDLFDGIELPMSVYIFCLFLNLSWL